MTTDEGADEPLVSITCPECETASKVPLSTVAERIDRHNQRLHDGQPVAVVDPAVADSLADLVATDMGLLDETE